MMEQLVRPLAVCLSANWLGGKLLPSEIAVSGSVFYGDEKVTSLPNTKHLACFCLPAKTGGGRPPHSTPSCPFPRPPGQAAQPVFLLRYYRSNLRGMSAGVQQINNAVQEVNDLARKNKDSIEGLASEVRKFKV